MTSLLGILIAGPANAQFLESFDEQLWGVQGSFTPTWNTPEQLRNLISADTVDISGSEYTIGFARGRMSGGHWGLSLVRQRIDTGSVCFPDECLDLADAQLQGFEFNRFLPFGGRFAGDTIQVGMNIGVGAGWYQGTVRVDGRDEEAREWLQFRDSDSIPIPLVRAEIAVAGSVGPGLKVIGSGGYGLPGSRRLTVSVAYFPLGDR